jgi:hypothetical protein
MYGVKQYYLYHRPQVIYKTRWWILAFIASIVFGVMEPHPVDVVRLEDADD